jgi:DNA-binding response OmpR family regulator
VGVARIALVEDPSTEDPLLPTLSSLGHEVLAYSDGAEALREIPSAGVDVVVARLELPVLDGVALCSALRARHARDELPVVLVSTTEREEDILRALEAGANDCLIQPFPPAVLRAKLTMLLRSRVAPPSELMALPGRRNRPPFSFGGFDVLETLGEGGSAVVYDAVRRQDGQRVALKLFREPVQEDRRALARTFREVAVLAALDSPHVVGIVDSGYEEERYFLAMERLDGRTAHDVVSEVGALGPSRTLAIGRDVCLALALLSEQELVHRDLKPSNVMLRRDGRATLLDFGLAKSSRDLNLTTTRELLGTPHYLAPEVVRGERETTGSDLYSLGATLHELLVGERPYAGGGDYQVLRRVAAGDPCPAVRELRPNVPGYVSDLVGWLMHPDPRERFATPSRAEAAISQCLARLALEESPVSGTAMAK